LKYIFSCLLSASIFPEYVYSGFSLIPLSIIS
jgi:hypothetical protein